MIGSDIPPEVRRFILSMPEDMRSQNLDSVVKQFEGMEMIDPIPDDHTTEGDLSTTASISWREREDFRQFVPPSKKETRSAISLVSRNGSMDQLESVISLLEEDRSQEALEYLRTSTEDILSYITGVDENGDVSLLRGTRQLIVGDVQFGKTQSATALVAAAMDLGSRFVIVMCNDTDRLRNQTQRRFSGLTSRESVFSPTEGSDLVSFNERDKKSAAFWGVTRPACVRHLRQDEGNSILLCIKKHPAPIRAAGYLLGYLERQGLLNDQPMLVIDDETDHASQNNFEGVFDNTPNTVASPTHRSIVNLVESYPSIFFGMTATSAAPIFQHPNDHLFPTDAHVLEPHELYLSGFDVFENYQDRIVEPCRITDFRLPDRNDDRLPFLQDQQDPPDSLNLAMLNHALSGALHHLFPRKKMPHKNRHAAMVNITPRILGQDEVSRLVTTAIANARDMLVQASQSTHQTVEDAINRFFDNRRTMRTVQQVKLPDREALIGKALWVLDTSEIMILNGSSDDDLDYDDPNFPDNIVCIGGKMLSRGLTIEGCRTSYFTHEPQRAVNDTTWQNARWLGPLKGDRDLLSIHLTPVLVDRFRRIAWYEAQFRDTLRMIKEQGESLLDIDITCPTGHLPSSKTRHMRWNRGPSPRRLLNMPWIDTIGTSCGSLRKALDGLNEPRHRPIKMPSGAMIRVTNEEAARFISEIQLSDEIDEKKKDTISAIRVIGEYLEDPAGAHILIRKGNGGPMGTEVPSKIRDLSPRRVKRASSDGLKIDQLISGTIQGTGTILDTDWFCDGFVPNGPTAQSLGMRSPRDPILIVVYVVDEHPDQDRRLNGSGPWVGLAVNLPHSGPGGSTVSNRHRGDDHGGI